MIKKSKEQSIFRYSMTVENYLNPNENIKEEFSNKVGASSYFASDRRLIDYRSSFFSEKYKDMDYNHITSIEMKRSGFRTLLLLGLALMTTGAILEMGWVIALGLFELVFASFFRYGKYKAVSSNGDKMTLCRHAYFAKIYETPKRSTEEFIEELRKLTGEKGK